MIRRLILLIFAAVLPVSAAHADTRSLYTVTDISVDESASNVIEAQQNAFAVARRLGTQRMISRITLEEDRLEKGGVPVDQTLADRLSAAVDVQEETRGGGRYIATLSAVLNPQAVRAHLRELNVPFIDTQAPTGLLVPIARDRLIGQWQLAWGERNDGALAPWVTATLPYTRGATWTDIQGEVGSARARRGLIAELSGAEGAFAATISVVTASGTVPIGTTRRVATMDAAVAEASALLDETWKRQSIVRSGARTLSEATVLYTSLPEWNSLRSALARSPLVSDFQIKAISSDGAVVNFAFAGDTDRLQIDLRQRGVDLDASAEGWVMTSAVSAIRQLELPAQ
ncbi:MAG: hypothetical protein AAFV54_03025 [Pseudomonadota bacterium]